jgi:hypothetical protein
VFLFPVKISKHENVTHNEKTTRMTTEKPKVTSPPPTTKLTTTTTTPASKIEYEEDINVKKKKQLENAGSSVLQQPRKESPAYML